MTDVTIHKLDLTLEQFAAMQETFPNINFHYTVYLLDREQDSTVTALTCPPCRRATWTRWPGSFPCCPSWKP